MRDNELKKAGPGLNRLRSDHAINSEYPGNCWLLAECVKSYRERQLQNQQIASVASKNAGNEKWRCLTWKLNAGVLPALALNRAEVTSGN